MKKIALILVSLILSTSISGCATANEGNYTRKWNQGSPEYLQLEKGITVRYVRTGNGPPLVLLHTIRMQLDYFGKLVPLLSG